MKAIRFIIDAIIAVLFLAWMLILLRPSKRKQIKLLASRFSEMVEATKAGEDK